jgi:tRNA threonylcarbamoyl adenosine modification protein YeaZ
MKILALEFSPPERSVAVLIDGQVCGYALDRTPQGSRAFAMISQALNEAKLEPAGIECIAIGVGPGSYAGARTAIAIAQGWELASGVKLLGVNSADAIARIAQRAGVLGTVNLVFDAQRNEVYASRYLVDGREARPLDSFQVLTSGEADRRRSAGEVFVRADSGPWGGPEIPVLLSDARVIGDIASYRDDYIRGHQLEPIYLRKAEFIKAPPPRFSMPES